MNPWNGSSHGSFHLHGFAAFLKLDTVSGCANMPFSLTSHQMPLAQLPPRLVGLCASYDIHFPNVRLKSIAPADIGRSRCAQNCPLYTVCMSYERPLTSYS